MFKKTKVRSVLELLQKNLSARDVSKILGVSRNTVAHIQKLYVTSGKTWDEVSDYTDEQLYKLFYPDKFKYKPRYAPVDYSYVHCELKKTGVTELLLWEEYSDKCQKEGTVPCSYITFTKNYKKYVVDKNYTSHIQHKPAVSIEVDWAGSCMWYTQPDTNTARKAYLFVATLPYSRKSYVEATDSMDEKAWLSCHVNMFNFFGGTPVKLVCDNLKTGVTAHPKNGEVILNEAYLSLGEYYSVAILPTDIRKPKQKASVEGTVGNVTTAIIARTRNMSFTSLGEINSAIKKALAEFNDKPFQKKNGSRSLIYEVEEKPYMKALPLVPYEVCTWSYGHKVACNSHIWWNKGQYSVPGIYIGKKVDVKYNSYFVYIYYNRCEIARHEILSKAMINAMRTDESHLPFPLKKDTTSEDVLEKAKETGASVFELVYRMYDEAKVKEQATLNASRIVRLREKYSCELLENACNKALKKYHMPNYDIIYRYLKEINAQKNTRKDQYSDLNNKSGIIRGADYYSRRGK